MWQVFCPIQLPAISVSAHWLDCSFVLVHSKPQEQHPYYIESRYKRRKKRSLESRTEYIWYSSLSGEAEKPSSSIIFDPFNPYYLNRGQQSIKTSPIFICTSFRMSFWKKTKKRRWAKMFYRWAIPSYSNVHQHYKEVNILPLLLTRSH